MLSLRRRQDCAVTDRERAVEHVAEFGFEVAGVKDLCVDVGRCAGLRLWKGVAAARDSRRALTNRELLAFVDDQGRTEGSGQAVENVGTQGSVSRQEITELLSRDFRLGGEVLRSAVASKTQQPGHRWVAGLFCGTGWQPARIPRQVENLPDGQWVTISKFFKWSLP